MPCHRPVGHLCLKCISYWGYTYHGHRQVGSLVRSTATRAKRSTLTFSTVSNLATETDQWGLWPRRVPRERRPSQTGVGAGMMRSSPASDVCTSANGNTTDSRHPNKQKLYQTKGNTISHLANYSTDQMVIGHIAGDHFRGGAILVNS